MLNVARSQVLRRAKESLYHLASCDEWMSMLALEFRHYSPNAAFHHLQEMLLDGAHCIELRRWPVHQRDDRGVASAVQDFLQPDLQRAELPARCVGFLGD